ncbi:MAG: hypothetical protein ACF8GE_00265 [Phycisphaerales bacterium JB043]
MSTMAQGLDVEYVHPTEVDDPARQFDFWVGEWDVLNKSKRGDQWAQWPSQAIIEGAVGGDAIVEFWNSLEPSADIVGFSMRWYDEEAQEWVIVLNWPQTSGSFSRMIGKLEGDAIVLYPPGFEEEGRQQGARFLFSKITPTSLQWHQEVTGDGGKTWDTTWIMEWTRRNHVNDPIDRDAHHRVDDVRCDAPEARAFDAWVGQWELDPERQLPGHRRDSSLSIRRVLGGCGISLSDGTYYSMWTYDSNTNEWTTATVRNQELVFGTHDSTDEGFWIRHAPALNTVDRPRSFDRRYVFKDSSIHIFLPITATYIHPVYMRKK